MPDFFDKLQIFQLLLGLWVEFGKQRGAADTFRAIITHNPHHLDCATKDYYRPKRIVGNKISSTKVITEPTLYGVITSQRRLQNWNILSNPYIDTHIWG